MNPETMTRVVALLTESSQWTGPGGKERALREAGGPLEELLQDLVKVDLEIEPDATPTEVVQAVCQALSPRVTDVISAFTVAFRQLAAEHDRFDPQITSADVLRNLGVRAAQRS
ncbi:hypothetical protein ACH4TP_38065 [Streptomyces sp. NPDC021012]|uniref:hypothetical protein n=1 Tax=Streptomyces sp. NPDC021012 TaxID=3365107 RepID=UPI00378F7FDB